MSALHASTPELQPTPLRVLFVHQSGQLYGSDRVLLDIVGELLRRGGHPIVVLAEGGPLVQSLGTLGIETHVLAPMQVLKLTRALMSLRGLWQLGRAASGCVAALDRCVGERPIDAVHSNTLAVMGGALWARRRRVPHLWHVHEIVERPRLAAWAFPRLVSRYAQRVLCNSRATLRWLLKHQPAMNPRCDVLHNGVPDMPRLPDSQLHRQFRPAGQPLAIGLVGRINRMKGHHLLIDAAERLARRGIREFSLVFVGNAPPGQPQWERSLHEAIERSPIGTRVVQTGFMADLGPVYAALDIVCIPSTEAEAFGLVAVEAMAAGLPVVAAHIGGLPEVVIDGETGLLHEPGNAADLAEQLALVIEDTAWREQLGRAGRARYESNFRVEAMTNGFIRALATTCEQAA